MNKVQLIFALRMEAAATRQALRDSEEAGLTPEQIDKLLERLKDLLDILNQLES